MNYNQQIVQKQNLVEANQKFEEAKQAKQNEDAEIKSNEESVKKNFNEIVKKRDTFMDSITDNENLQESITQMCNHLKEFTGSTGVYVVSLSQKTRMAKDSDKIEEVLTTDAKTLKFFATNDDHTFLLKKDHDINTLTGGLFEKKNTGEDAVEETGEEGEAKAVKKLIYYDDKDNELGETLTEEQKKDMEELFIPEVIANDKVR